jgi:adenosylhomocysteine nucleosidase
MKSTLGIAFALASEARAILGRSCWRQDRGRLFRRMRLSDGTDLIAVCSGVGYENALLAARRLTSLGVSALAGMGFAGGLYPGAQPGDLIIADIVLQMHRNEIRGSWKADPACLALAYAAFVSEGLAVRCGRLVAADRPALTAVQKEVLFKQTRALAIDMESAALATAAREQSIPFFVLRAVCDPPDETVPAGLYDCLDADGSIRLAFLLLQLIRRPALLSDLRKMTVHYTAAKAALRRGWQMQVKNNLPRLLASGGEAQS